MDATFVGIDVSKDRLDVAVLPAGDLFVVPRDAAGLDQLLARLRPLRPEAIALEATGGFETVVAATLGAAGLPAGGRRQPGRRPRLRQGARPARQDRSDRRPPDRPLRGHHQARGAPLPDEATQRLADLVARRRQIIAMIVAERQRQKRFAGRAHAPDRLRRSIARLLDALQRELSEVDAEIDSDVRGSPAWREKEGLLASVPGIGPIIARALIAEMPELGSLDRREVAALAGLAPWTRQSGRWKGRSFLGGGRAAVRAGGAAHGRRHRIPAQPGPQGLP
jgi:transposase